MTTEKPPIWSTTGNPFVDMGQEMMAALAGVDHPNELSLQDVEALPPKLVELFFLPEWNKSSYTIFPNSALNNGSNRKEKYKKLLELWLTATEHPKEHNIGTTCAISGKPAQTYLGKVYLPMSDFEEGNFQSANQKGTPVSASVALALQFFPFALIKVGKMLALPQFSNDDAQAQWAKQSMEYIRKTQALGQGGVRDTGTFRAVKAFFKLIEDMVRQDQDLPNSSVMLYLFNNFNQVDYKAASELYYMPSRVFNFIQLAMSQTTRQAWQRIVRRGYRLKKEIDDEAELQKYGNLVYNRLLDDQSISGFFLDRKHRSPVVRGREGWLLFSAYLKEVRSMEQRRLENLRDLADRMAPLIRQRTKRLLSLERADKKGKFVEVLYRLTKDATSAGHDKPLITFDQLISDVLAQENTTYDDWREVKSLLLFRIYEQLHDDLKKDPEFIQAEEEDTDSQEEENE